MREVPHRMEVGGYTVTMIWVVFAVLIGLAVFAVLWPLSRAPAVTDARELDVAFYQAQKDEIARDEARGVIGGDEAETARTEAARRLMAASRRESDDVKSSRPFAVRFVALASLVFVPALALGLYTRIGAPTLPDMPLQARMSAPADQLDMASAIAKIEQHLVKEPKDGRGWAVLAPIYVRLNKLDEAKEAYRNAIANLTPNADLYAGLGEVYVYGDNGRVGTDAAKAFDEAVKIDPSSPRGNYYLGVAAEQGGDKAKAEEIWRKLIANSPPDAPWLPTVKTRMAALTGKESGGIPAAGASQGGPDQSKMAAVAAMPKDQQQAMIHTMVDRLADRLKTNGNDIEGWLRLVRAYRVLDEQDKAKGALSDARRNFAADANAKKRLDDLAHELGLEG